MGSLFPDLAGDGERKTAAAFLQLPSLCWRRAIFPGRRQPSIVATDELNFRVRNGNGWTLIVIGTDFEVLCALRRSAHSKLNRGGDKEDLSLLFLRTCRLSPRAISTGQLNTLPCLHLRPIDQIVSLGPYSLEEMGDLILGGVSRLDAFSVYLVRT